MAEIINLNKARKQATKQANKKQAESNRLVYGRTRLEREQSQKNEASRVMRLDGHRLDTDIPED